MCFGAEQTTISASRRAWEPAVLRGLVSASLWAQTNRIQPDARQLKNDERWRVGPVELGHHVCRLAVGANLAGGGDCWFKMLVDDLAFSHSTSSPQATTKSGLFLPHQGLML